MKKFKGSSTKDTEDDKSAVPESSENEDGSANPNEEVKMEEDQEMAGQDEENEEANEPKQSEEDEDGEKLRKERLQKEKDALRAPFQDLMNQ